MTTDEARAAGVYQKLIDEAMTPSGRLVERAAKHVIHEAMTDLVAEREARWQEEWPWREKLNALVDAPAGTLLLKAVFEQLSLWQKRVIEVDGWWSAMEAKLSAAQQRAEAMRVAITEAIPGRAVGSSCASILGMIRGLAESFDDLGSWAKAHLPRLEAALSAPAPAEPKTAPKGDSDATNS